ncbi:MAG: hypothetical protein KJ077_10370 [Anaerolineae bacterium]|nr:hypothetical protein [Anaerolineae bacterium]
MAIEDARLYNLRGTGLPVFGLTPADDPGAPVSGTFSLGDLWLDSDGSYWRCTVAGSPGTWEELGSGGTTDVAAAIHAAAGKTTPVDDDELGLVDSEASWALKKLTWANLKATLQTWLGALLDATSVTKLRKLDNSGDAFYVADANGGVFGIDSLAVTGQLSSLQSTGSPPLVVFSTTVVPNLNTDKLDGADLDTDTGLMADSDAKIPSQRAIKSYTDMLIGTRVPVTRTISTTAPLSGGGDLSANRTLSLDLSYASLAPIPNIFINGSFIVAQRMTSARDDTGVTTTRKYTFDCWAVKTGAGTLAHVKQTSTVRSGAKSRYAMELEGATGVTTVDVDQRIESIFSGRYKGQVDFSVYVYNDTGAAFTPKLFVSTPSATDNWASSTVRNGGGSGEDLQSCADGQWTKVTWTADISGYTNIDNGVEFRLRIPSGSLVASDIVRLAEPNLVPGSVDTAFAEAPNVISLCQRYCWEVNRFTAAAHMLCPSGYCTSSTTASLHVQFPVEMRTTPTLVQSGTASDYAVSDSAAANTNLSSVPTLGGATNTKFARILATVASGLTQHRPAVLQSTLAGNGYLIFEAGL